MIAPSLLSLLVSLSGAPQGTHPFGVDDMLAMQRISEPAVSPDGALVAFTLRTTDLAANRGRTDVWMVPADGSRPPRAMTSHEAGDSSPLWGRDGRSIWFLSTRGGSSQVWSLALDGGEARQVTHSAVDVAAFGLFPDAELVGEGGEPRGRLWLVLEVYPDAATLAETVARDADRAASPVQARIYDELLFRHWDTWEDGKRSHLFTWTIGEDDAPRDLMRGMDVDTPTRPFGGAEEIALSPDGLELVFAAKDEGRENAWSTNVDLWSVPTDGSSAPARLTVENEALDSQPAFSPDGRWLAWLAMERPGYESDRQHVELLDRHSGDRRMLAASWDRSAGELAWAADSSTLFTSADDLGNHSLFAIDVATGEVRRLASAGTNGSPRPVARGRVLYAHDDLRSPVELFTMAADGTDVRALTAINAERVRAARMGEYEPFTFTGAHGDTVHGFLVRPADFESGRRYPVAFLIHGGPQGSFGDHFHYRWNPQAYAGAGYAAVMIDFHGSTGYGQAFCDAIRGDWGGAPYEDLMLGLDAALERYSFLDGERVAALGASYGGYMINWIAGHTDRFRCLVNHDGNLDERMAYFDTEELWFPEWDHGGLPWEEPEHYAKHNPIEFVERWKTPMLVVHGALDYRVVDTQGMSTFTALQRRGIPSRLLYFPDENHWVLKPRNSQLWHETVLDWLARWTR